MFAESPLLLNAEEVHRPLAERLLTEAGFQRWESAWRRLQSLASDVPSRLALTGCLPGLFVAFSEAANPDAALINFERYTQSIPDRAELYGYLSAHPRAVEILFKLFVGSQFLTEILLRNPTWLEKITNHKRLAEIKSRQQFIQEGADAAAEFEKIEDQLDALRRFQRWELLRIGGCDNFGLMDLKSVTVQLSLLADSLVQNCADLLAEAHQLDSDGFVVLAFGKLGGEELNYSSDIDLVFLSDQSAERLWPLGQRLIRALTEATTEGFLYRVDMRLRPWGSSGALVNTVDAHLKYLEQQGQLWEKQALIKARPIAGSIEVGQRFLSRAAQLIFHTPEDKLRDNIQEMKRKIEAKLQKQGRTWGQVKGGVGSIRDVEFVTQFLQLKYGGENQRVRSFNTLNALVRLADFSCIQADEFRGLTEGYQFLRVLEHSMQLMHNKQVHSLPEDRGELTYLARRLDFSSVEHFLTYYARHTSAIRAIYDKYIEGRQASRNLAPKPSREEIVRRMFQSEPSYTEVFTDQEIGFHAELVEKLSDENVVEVVACPAPAPDVGLWKVTIVGFDSPGDLSMICGLLFAYGFDIVSGHAFTGDQVAQLQQGESRASRLPRFVDVFTVRPPEGIDLTELWSDYKTDLATLLEQVREGRKQEAQGQLVKRVARALNDVPETAAQLYPVEIAIDNETSERYTVLQIQADDTIGFLYELCNALTLAEIDVKRVIVQTVGNQVHDRLYITDSQGRKITDPEEQKELRAAVVLIKHFTHLLPRSPNPESALIHFRDFLEQQFQTENWYADLSSLVQPDVLDALAQLLGVSDFLWEDFLRLQHDNLYPVVREVELLQQRKDKETLEAELVEQWRNAPSLGEARRMLNAFKDREMFRIDMRHILDHIEEFGQFSRELTDVAEVVVEAGCHLAAQELEAAYGPPLLENGQPCGLSVCALGKAGGRELGFASDIELMFLYAGHGETSGPTRISNAEHFPRLVELFCQNIEARREGIFQIDLRLRPYGKAGSKAVTLETFRDYFAPDGPAWPYERQALVKLRPIVGDAALGRQVESLRDQLIYRGEPFDAVSMRAMREKQVLQLVEAGTFNAKLSLGGLVDVEYLVQGLQIAHGHREESLRSTNTRAAMKALCQAGILSETHYRQLRSAHIFLRQLIDALRMVRGHARDLSVPPEESEEFEFLARRLGYRSRPKELLEELEKQSTVVRELGELLH